MVSWDEEMLVGSLTRILPADSVHLGAFGDLVNIH